MKVGFRYSDKSGLKDDVYHIHDNWTLYIKDRPLKYMPNKERYLAGLPKHTKGQVKKILEHKLPYLLFFYISKKNIKIKMDNLTEFFKSKNG